MKKLIVNKKNNGKKLNTFIFEELPTVSSSLFYKTLRKKDIKINGKRITENVRVYEGDEVLVYIDVQFLTPNITLKIVFEDDNILIVDKPYNLEVTGDNSLTSILHSKYDTEFKPMPCHRIDRNTTGLVLFAKNELALQILLKKFEQHEIEKHYLALAYGVPAPSHKRCEAFLFKDKKRAQVYISDTLKKGYQKIITTYSLLEKYNNNTSLLDVQIETGKTHQIRAHLAYLGYPIIGDR